MEAGASKQTVTVIPLLNFVSKKLAVLTFWLIALEGKKILSKVIPRWKDNSE